MSTTFKKVISLMAYDAPLTERTDDFYLRAKTQKDSLDLHAIAREYAAQTGKPEDDVYAVLNGCQQIIADAVASGYIVNTPTALIRPSASGTVVKADLSRPVDRTKVKVYATLSMGQLLRDTMEQCGLEIFTQPAVVGPLLNGAVAQTRVPGGDAATRAPQAGKNLTLTGRNIKVVGDDPSVGITFTSVENPQTTVKVPMEDITVNEPTRLIFVLPDGVTDGLWNVTITTQYGSGGGRFIKTPRSYELDEPLAVGSAYTDPDDSGQGGQGGTEPGGGGDGENPMG